LHPAQKGGEIHGANSPGDLFSVLKDDGGGNALNSQLLSDHGLGFRVDLGEAKSRLQLSSGLVEDGSHPLAWPTPGSPEIYNDRDFIARNILFKIGAGQFNGSCNEQFVFASSAFGLVPQAYAFHAVGGATMGADNLDLFVHGLLLII
jgi:hypothetical protein